MKKTKLTRSLLAACSIVALSAVMYGCVHDGGDDAPATDMSGTPDPMPEPMPDPAAPVDVTMDVDVSDDDVQERLWRVLSDSDSSNTLTIPAGGMATRGASATQPGVVFTCMSDYPCTVTVTNSLGTILASVTTQMLPDADDPVVTAGLPDAVDTFAELNDGNTPSIRNLVGAADESTPTLQPTELIGMGIGGPGVLNADEAGLRSLLDPNGAAFGTGANENMAAGPGADPTLAGGSTITGADDAIDPSDDMAPAPDGWGMKTLFRDWGDTAAEPGDGGFETGAIVVKNLGEGTPYPFDRKLSGKYVNDAAQDMFALSIRANGDLPGVTTLGTSVNIGSVEVMDGDVTLPEATSTQWAAMEFDSDSLVGAQDQDLSVNNSETFTGSYFGAPGQFQCIMAAANNGPGCGLVRNDDGTVGVNDGDLVMMGIQGDGRWSFTPDPGAMITVPDQDWMAYGAWLTTPDDAGGTHKIGVFFNGMDPYEGNVVAADSIDAFNATNADGLRGSATYSGGATGIYVDGADSGLFTAEASLTANFDKTSNGTDIDDLAADADDFMISGRIDNFRGTDGVFLGDDTQASPNDPTAGENDWVIMLRANATVAGGVLAETTTSGSADGVEWNGMWNGQLFGPNTDADGDSIAPSGVAGQFRAQTLVTIDERTVPIRLMQTHTTCRMLPLAILGTQSTPSGCMRKADRHG